MIIGAAYLRCSDPRQDKSIDQQREEIARRAQADGVTIPPDNWFVDEGISGRSSKKRHAYQEMIRRAEAQRDAQKGRVRVQPVERLYVWAFSRIARNMFDCLRALATLDDAGIEVVSLTEQDSGDKSMRKLIRPILAWLAERYSEELAHNVQRGMRSQAEKGFWLHGLPPFGYAAVPVQGGGSRLVVTDETRADFETVQRVFREYLEGRDGWKRLAEKLTREGVRSPSRRDMPRRRGLQVWRTKHLQQILTSPTYAGHIAYDGEIACRNAHEAAVSQEDWDRAQALRHLKEKVRRNHEGNGHNPIRLGERGVLTPWLRCGLCGGRMSVVLGGSVKKRPYHYYNCSSRIDNKLTCAGLSVRVERLDGAVLDHIHRDVLTPENVQGLVADALTRLAEAPDEVAAERQRLEVQVADLDRRIRVTGAQVTAGVLDLEDAKAVNAPLVAQRETARLRLAALPEHRSLPAADQVDPERFRAAVLQAWAARPLAERRVALDRLLESVTLSEKGATIAYRVKDESLAFRYQEPPGPPSGSWGQYEVRVEAPEARLPAARSHGAMTPHRFQ